MRPMGAQNEPIMLYGGFDSKLAHIPQNTSKTPRKKIITLITSPVNISIHSMALF